MTSVSVFIIFILAPMLLVKTYLTEKENKILRKKLGK